TELFERSRRLAGGLIELGIEPGDRVVVSMANCPEVGIVYNALWRAGAVVTPAMFLLPREELAHVIGNSEATAVVTTPEFVDKVLEAGRGTDRGRFVISGGDVGDDNRVVSLPSLGAADPASIVDRD